MWTNLYSLSTLDWEKLNCATGDFKPDGASKDTDDDDEDNLNTGGTRSSRKKQKKRKIHKRRSYHYKIGDYKKATYYTKFLSNAEVSVPGVSHTTVRELTRQQSLNPKSLFRLWFHMPLYKVEEIVKRIIDEKVVSLSHHCRSEDQLAMKVELLVLGTLAVLGGSYSSFRQIPTLTNIGATEHINFFLKFLDFMWSTRDEYIYLPWDACELRMVMKRYEEMGLPGAMGSVDVVHNCPKGDFNCAKGKESYPSLGFECISDFDRRICHVYGPSFGSRNNKHIVKNDSGVRTVGEGMFLSARWMYFDDNGNQKTEIGVFLICDNGYLQWRTLICPYM